MIPTYILPELYELFACYPAVEQVVLFGSRARGDFHSRSNIDLIIKAPSLSQEDWLHMVFRMTEELNTLLSVDLIRWEDASTSLREKALSEGRVIYERGTNSAKLKELGESASTIRRSISGNTHEQPLH